VRADPQPLRVPGRGACPQGWSGDCYPAFRVVSVTAFERIVRLRLLGLRDRLLGQGPAREGGDGARQEVEEIEAALARIAEGTFGVCEKCGRALGQTRLLAEPVARLCHACGPKQLH